MFRLFNNIPTTFALQEVQAGQHLKHATAGSTDLFFNQEVLSSSQNWQLLYLNNQKLYWGKVQQEQVAEANFYQLEIATLEKDFPKKDTENKNIYLEILRQYVVDDLDQIDGARYRLLDLEYTSLSITLLTSWEFILKALVEYTNLRTPDAPPKEAVVPYRVIINPINFSIIQARML